MTNIVTNLFGDLALDTTIKSLLQKFGRFSFTTDSSLRVNGAVTANISSGSLNSVGTVSQVNIAIGDIGKPATAQVMSAQMFYGTVGANFVRS